VFVRNPFRWKHVKDSFHVIIKPRIHHNRAHLLLVFAVVFINNVCKSGEINVAILYTAKSPLTWSGSTYGYFLAIDYLCLGISLALLAPGLVHFFHLDDTTLCIIGVSFRIARLAMMSYGQYTWVVFLSVVVGGPGALVVSSAKSMTSKLVDVDEVGKSFSLLSLCENIAGCVGSLLFPAIYAVTFQIYGGLVFVIQASMMVVVGGAFIPLIYDQRRSKTPQSYTLLDERHGANDDKETISNAAQLTDSDMSNSYGAINQSSQSGRSEEGPADRSPD